MILVLCPLLFFWKFVSLIKLLQLVLILKRHHVLVNQLQSFKVFIVVGEGISCCSI